MKDMKRALRRSHRLRLIARTLKLFVNERFPVEDRLYFALRLYNNRKNCDCFMCNRTRKHYGPTVQELRQECWDKIEARLPGFTK